MSELITTPTVATPMIETPMSLLAVRLALQRLAYSCRQFANTLQDVLEEVDRELAQGKAPAPAAREALLGKTVLFQHRTKRHRGEVSRIFSDGWLEVHEGEKVFTIRPEAIEEVDE